MKRCLFVALVAALTMAFASTAISQPIRSKDVAGFGRTTAKGIGPEIPTPPYPGYTYYSDLGAILAKIDKASARVRVYGNGHSADGHPMWTVVVNRPFKNKALAAANALYRRLLLTNPVKAKKMIKTGIRPVVFINCSIHGSEPTGVDAGLKILRRLAYKNDPETMSILNRLTVVIDPCQNPDGRIRNQGRNGVGMELNRDFITLTQPETQATVRAIKKYVPVTFLDLHSYLNPMLIEPCTFPHNTNVEHDLFIKWALPQAKYQSAYLRQHLGLASQIPYLYGTAEDQLQQVNEYWDDYGPYYGFSIPLYFGAVGQTLETTSNTTEGVAAHVATSWAALKFTAKHSLPRMRDQAAALIRGDKNASNAQTGRPWQGNMTRMIRPVPWGDPTFPYSNIVGDVTFPYAYVIPGDGPLQRDPWAAIKFVNHARKYGIEVDRARSSFVAGGTTYPAGSWVVSMRQPLRDLANTMLWKGEDVRAKYGATAMFDISAWSLQELWGFDAFAIDSPFSAVLARVTDNVARSGEVVGDGPWYYFDGTNNESLKLVNVMIRRRYQVGMVTRKIAAPLDGMPVGSFVVNGSRAYVKAFLKRAADEYGLSFVEAPGLAASQIAVFYVGEPNDQFGDFIGPDIAVLIDADKGFNTDDAQAVWVLKDYLGFKNVTYDTKPSDSNTVVVNSNWSASSPTLEDIQTWLAGGSGTVTRTYVGIGGGGTGYGDSPYEALIPGVTTHRSADRLDNGIVFLNYDQHSIITAGYPAHDYAFAYPPAWYTGENASVGVGTYGVGVDGGPYQSGYWLDPAVAAAGSAAILDYEPTAHSRVVFYGFQPYYRGMTDGTYLTLARSILLSNATQPTAP